jgi:hypothetical protein
MTGIKRGNPVNKKAAVWLACLTVLALTALLVVRSGVATSFTSGTRIITKATKLERGKSAARTIAVVAAPARTRRVISVATPQASGASALSSVWAHARGGARALRDAVRDRTAKAVAGATAAGFLPSH